MPVSNAHKKTIIAQGTFIDGTFNFQNNSEIRGEVKGKLTSDSKITISETGKVTGSIVTNEACICGHFEGDMTAAGQVEISSHGRFIGNLYQKEPLLVIHKGGILKGEILPAANNRPKL
ncbi:MAG: bactofilin family protein [Actinomycetota bacterium]